MIDLLLALVFVHFIFDFCLQSKFMSDYKGKLPFVMGVHVFIWTYAITRTAMLFGEVPFWVPIFLFIGHWAFDKVKLVLIERENLKDEKNPDVYSRLKYLFHIDQILHLVQIIIVSFYVEL